MLVGIALLAGANHGEALGSCGRFASGTLSGDALKNEFGRAVLRVKTEEGEHIGTGYLIHAGGYVLTARHVIAPPRVEEKIVLESDWFPDVKLRASVVKSIGAPVDLALLKLREPRHLAGIRPIDISFLMPGIDTWMFAMGYPQMGNTQPHFHAQQVTVAANPEGLIQVTQPGVHEGASGGPLIDASGSALGTCRQSVGVGASLARYVPTVAARELLDAIPMSEEMRELDEKVRTGGISAPALNARMMKAQGNPSNVDLYAWTRRIKSRPQEYTQARPLLQCPLMYALYDRGLRDLVVEMSQFANPTLIADSKHDLAKRELALGNYVSALALATEAESTYRVAGLRQQAASVRITTAAAQLAAGNVKAATNAQQTLLAEINLLPELDRAHSRVVVARIEERNRRFPQALANYDAASLGFRKEGMYNLAADAHAGKADVKVKQSLFDDALAELRTAASYYSMGNNAIGEGSAIYRMATVKQLKGDKPGVIESLKAYLGILPNGIHSREASIVVEANRSTDNPL